MTGYYRRPSANVSAVARDVVQLLLGDLEAVRSEVQDLRRRSVLREDIPNPAEVAAEIARPSPLGPSSCIDHHRPVRAAKARVRGRSVHMVVNETRMRFQVASEPYTEDGEMVVDLRGSSTGLVLEAVPIGAVEGL
ncbi:MAG TPA: hypothetical protein PLL78_09290 [Fimbriimonadaceae bacterium]|nr:hypothetical protein [Fimbriimonadaceae bacterium]